MTRSDRVRTALAMRAGERPLRRCLAADLPAVIAFQRAAYACNRDALGTEPLPLLADYQAILRDMEIWLCEEGERLSGVLILEPHPTDLMIWSIATAPEARCKGLGGGLLAAAQSRARTLNKATLTLYTGERLTHLIAWYQHHGFSVDRVEASPDRRLVHMSKPLL